MIVSLNSWPRNVQIEDMGVTNAKNLVREHIWSLLEREAAVTAGAHGRIPSFVGADAAAQGVASLPEWRSAKVIKAVPDEAQLPVRIRALIDGKLLYMAVPRLAGDKPFYLLDPSSLTVPPVEAASKRGAASVARKVDVDEMRPVDLIICGSVAVNRAGVRLGKGAGYSDIEVALLQEGGLISDQTTIVTTVHPLQVLADDLPETDHDFRVDIVVTPDEIIRCRPHPRPGGIRWEDLTPEQISEIPALAARQPGER